MQKIIFSVFGHSPALLHARNRLESWGYAISPDPNTATHLLLPVPTGTAADTLPGLRPDVTVFGGYLPDLPYRQVDLLRDEHYLVENAAITAQCALRYAAISPGTQVLVIGWGRIGKHLAALLSEAGADVTVAVRKRRDHDALQALGVDTVYLADLQPERYAVIFNTAPAPVLAAENCREEATLVDLASQRGITGEPVIWARGLPGKDAPELSGNLIAKTVLRYTLGKE